VGEIYKAFCKGEITAEGPRKGDPVSADVIVRGVSGREAALLATAEYFDTHTFLVPRRTDIGFLEITDGEKAFYSGAGLRAIGEQVVLVAFYENNPPPDPAFYKLPPCGLTDK
jgi:hypothetical protein